MTNRQIAYRARRVAKGGKQKSFLLSAEAVEAKDAHSAWCQRMAWPGRAPTPPYAAWADLKICINRLAELGEKRSRRF